jgi:hypothetical protein
VLKEAERWSWDAKRSYNGWRGGWNTWHLSLESDNDENYYNDYVDLVREYNDALADNPDFNQDTLREALSRHWLMIMKNSDADYIIHQIDFDELWEHFLSDAKEEREDASR